MTSMGALEGQHSDPKFVTYVVTSLQQKRRQARKNVADHWALAS
jgi:hypothetical protein